MAAPSRFRTSRVPGLERLLVVAALLAGCASPAAVSPSRPLAEPTPSSATPSIAMSSPSPSAMPSMTAVKPTAVIDVPGATGVIAATTDGSSLWAATNGAILRIDTATNKVERVSAPAQSDDTTLAIAADGLWMSRWAGGHLYRLDPRTGKVLLSVDLPKAVTIAFVGDDLWVGREDAHEMLLVNRKTGALGRALDAGAYGRAGLGDMWFTPGGATTIERVDPGSGSVKATIAAKGESNCGLGGEFPDNVWLSCFGPDVSSRVATRIDPASNTVTTVATIPPSHGGSVAVVDDRAWFVGSFEDAAGQPFGGILRLDGDTGAVDRFASIGPADPDGVVVAAGAIWIPDESGHRILRVNVGDLSG